VKEKYVFTAQVVSMRSSTDRRNRVKKDMAGSPLKWNFYDGLNAQTPCVVEPDLNRQISKFGRVLSPAEVGCFKSHFSLLQQFVANRPSNWLLVLEDDVWIDNEFPFARTIKMLDEQNISYLRLFARRLKHADVITQFSGSQLVRFRSDPYGTQAYLINRKGAMRFLRSVEAIERPIDDELGRFWRHGLDIYALFPFPAVEVATTSTIEQERSEALQSKRQTSLPILRFKTAEKLRKTGANAKFLLRFHLHATVFSTRLAKATRMRVKSWASAPSGLPDAAHSNQSDAA
jgi:glycosyl transferase family 25